LSRLDFIFFIIYYRRRAVLRSGLRLYGFIEFFLSFLEKKNCQQKRRRWLWFCGALPLLVYCRAVITRDNTNKPCGDIILDEDDDSGRHRSYYSRANLDVGWRSWLIHYYWGWLIIWYSLLYLTTSLRYFSIQLIVLT